ncbi:MAG: hypothetical protein IJS53_05235 [Clostridia bacterium]|nr:hypothetical protein [Clostridia bacterium]
MKQTISRVLAAALCLALTLALCPAGFAAGAPRPILYTYYRQAGWGDRVQVACVDEDGGLWLAVGCDSEMRWPWSLEEQLAWMQTAGNLEKVGELTSGALFDLNSLVLSAEDCGEKTVPCACDAGTEYSYIVRYDREDGAPERVLLGASGDDLFENFDPNAQALYRWLRETFPQVTSYAGLMGPVGFTPISLLAFCGKADVDLSGAEVTAFSIDCEAGPIELEITEDEKEAARARVMYGTVTGKANATTVTGGTVVISFREADGRFLCSFEFYRGLLVRQDGMYYVE